MDLTSLISVYLKIFCLIRSAVLSLQEYLQNHPYVQTCFEFLNIFTFQILTKSIGIKFETNQKTNRSDSAWVLRTMVIKPPRIVTVMF